MMRRAGAAPASGGVARASTSPAGGAGGASAAGRVAGTTRGATGPAGGAGGATAAGGGAGATGGASGPAGGAGGAPTEAPELEPELELELALAGKMEECCVKKMLQCDTNMNTTPRLTWGTSGVGLRGSMAARVLPLTGCLVAKC